MPILAKQKETKKNYAPTFSLNLIKTPNNYATNK